VRVEQMIEEFRVAKERQLLNRKLKLVMDSNVR
jgi:hypothetical protein